MLGVQDRAEIMAGLGVGLSQARIARLIGRCPSVVCREIVRREGPDEAHRAEDAIG
jgi:IS1603, transposase